MKREIYEGLIITKWAIGVISALALAYGIHLGERALARMGVARR